jgi:nicotinamidase-related amidase
MNSRPWERFLSENDRAHLAASAEHRDYGWGEKPALLLIDIYRGVFGDERVPLLEGIKTWPGYTGPHGWDAAERVKDLIGVCRDTGVPIIHVTGNPLVPHWSDRIGVERKAPRDPEAADRLRRRFDIVEQVAPIEGEVVFRKSSPSAFWGTALIPHLRYIDVDTLIVCGESTSGCVRATVVDGCTQRFRMKVVEEGVWDRHELSHAANLFDMHQKYADVISLAETIDWLHEWRSRQSSAPRELAGVS